MILRPRLGTSLGLPSDRLRARATLILLIDNLLMWMGFFMIVPLISVHYVNGLGWAASLVGIVLALRQFTQQGLTVFSGALADRFGARGLILMGLLVRAVGFGSMAYADTFSHLLLSSLLAGLGGAFFESPKSAAMAALSDPETRRRIYAVQGISNNVGMALGVLIGGFLIQASFKTVALGSGCVYFLTFLLSMFILPQISVATGRRSLLSGIMMAARDRRFLIFTLISMGYFMIWVQLSLTVSLQAEKLAGTEHAVSWVFLTNTLFGISLQYPLVRWLEPRLKPINGLIMGTAIMTLGLGFIGIINSIWLLLLCVAIFAVGSAILSPNQQTVVADLADSTAFGSYMGFGGLSLAVGGALGNFLGGSLYDLGIKLNFSDLPWLVFFIVGSSSVVGLVWFSKHYLVNPSDAPSL
ncbi:MAG: MFS transporter [Trueperaceae bacterium]|nr:MFS transporter [Trueperaceae bacterium]